MKAFSHRTLSVFALAALAAALHTAPAQAGGRSGAHAAMPDKQATAQASQMQAQIDALRKEMAELKAQQAQPKGQAAAQ